MTYAFFLNVSMYACMHVQYAYMYASLYECMYRPITIHPPPQTMGLHVHHE